MLKAPSSTKRPGIAAFPPKARLSGSLVSLALFLALAPAVEASTVPLARPDGTSRTTASAPAAPSAAPQPAAAPGAFSGLSPADISALTAAYAETDRGNRVAAAPHVERIKDPVARKLVTWTRLLSDRNMGTFAEIVAFIEQNPDWPRIDTLNSRAEAALLSYPTGNDDIAEWFAVYPPRSGEGRIRYGKALIELGRAEEGAEWIRRAWV